MPAPRKSLVSLQDTPYYHCISRCVRRAFLCGLDQLTGKSYEHRRGWVEQRLLHLAEIFAIDICAYAVMSNHLHVVLHVDLDKAKRWSDLEVIEQWHRLHKGTPLTQAFIQGDSLSKAKKQELTKQIIEYRSRLCDISWFMRALNEPIARMANKEDECKGRFWEGRFKSQALLDETALLACMAYVDLNPIRAKISDTPIDSTFTSIQRRIQAKLKGVQPKELMKFNHQDVNEHEKCLPLGMRDYIKLVEETAFSLVHHNSERLVKSERILMGLNLPCENWLRLCSRFSKMFKGPAGNLMALTEYCQRLDRRRRQGAANSAKWLTPNKDETG
ncbi:transposase [Parashewanella tropica]|uniref:transposase n=1 Tax=Parashewanella tropica TaxID=2547970 RepID=UPI00105978EA|nr:transposase [Parashewanella tropica]